MRFPEKSSRLPAPQERVFAVGFQQFLVGAVFGCFAVRQDNDPVQRSNGGETVGHYNGSAALHQVDQGVLYQFFRFGIQGAGCLIQHQNRGVCQNGPGDGHTLPLAAGKLDAPFAYQGIKPLGELFDKLQCIGLPGSGTDFLRRGIRFAVGDIFTNGPVEQQGFLGDIGNLAPQGLLGAGRDVLAVYQNFTLLDIRETQQEFGQGGFA